MVVPRVCLNRQQHPNISILVQAASWNDWIASIKNYLTIPLFFLFIFVICILVVAIRLLNGIYLSGKYVSSIFIFTTPGMHINCVSSPACATVFTQLILVIVCVRIARTLDCLLCVCVCVVTCWSNHNTWTESSANGIVCDCICDRPIRVSSAS